MGLQVSHCVYPEVPQEGALQDTSPTFGRGVPRSGPATRVQDRGRPFDVGPCTHPDLDTAEIRSVAGGWVYQGQERGPLGADVWGTKTELCWPAYLDAGIWYRQSAGTRP